MTSKLLDIPVQTFKKKEILEKISFFLEQPKGFFHVVSLNPETMVQAAKNQEFKKVLSQSNIKLIDGVGVVLGCRFLSILCGERVTGTDFMEQLLDIFSSRRLRVLIMGGRPDLANKLAKCYENKYQKMSFKGILGIKNIENPAPLEEENILAIVADYRPQIIFSSFGSPYQELWFYRHKDRLNGIICMGVGGGFDFAAGTIIRAPAIIRAIGLEWLFRLIIQPWRLRRQLRLAEFVYLVLRQRFL